MGKRLHLDGSLGAEVGLEHILEAFGGVDVHVQGRGLVEDLGVGVQHSNRHFSASIFGVGFLEIRVY